MYKRKLFPGEKINMPTAFSLLNRGRNPQKEKRRERGKNDGSFIFIFFAVFVARPGRRNESFRVYD